MKLLKRKGLSYIIVYTVSLLISASIITTGSYYYVKAINSGTIQNQIKNAYIKSELNNIISMCTASVPSLDNYKYRKPLTSRETLTVNLNCNYSPTEITFSTTLCSVLNSNEEIKNCKIYNGSIFL